MDKGNYVTLSRSFEKDFVLEEIMTFSGLTFDRRITKDAYNAEAFKQGQKDLRKGQQSCWKSSDEDDLPKQH